MKKKIAALTMAAIVMVAALCMLVTAFDGNDYSYDGGGGGDWGSSDYSSDYSSSDYSSSGGGDGSTFISAVVIAVVLIVIVSIVKSKGNGGASGGGAGVGGGVRPGNGGQGRNVNLPDRTAEIENIIKQNDPNFSASDFISFTKQVYIDIQMAWCARDLSPVRPLLHTNLYNTTDKQVQMKLQQGVTYHYESMVVNTAYLTSYAKDEQFEYATIYLNARMIDYQTDDKTGNIVRGDKNTRWDMRYKMKFMRSSGVLTKQESGQATGHNCPNCGAPMEISASGECPYCGSVVTTGMYTWVLCDFGTIRDDTRDDGISMPQQ